MFPLGPYTLRRAPAENISFRRELNEPTPVDADPAPQADANPQTDAPAQDAALAPAVEDAASAPAAEATEAVQVAPEPVVAHDGHDGGVDEGFEEGDDMDPDMPGLVSPSDESEEEFIWESAYGDEL